MLRGKVGEQLIGIESDFTRNGADDRTAVDTLRQFGDAAAFELFDGADRQLRRVGELPVREAFGFAGLAQTDSGIERAMPGRYVNGWTLVVCQNCRLSGGQE